MMDDAAYAKLLQQQEEQLMRYADYGTARNIKRQEQQLLNFSDAKLACQLQETDKDTLVHDDHAIAERLQKEAQLAIESEDAIVAIRLQEELKGASNTCPAEDLRVDSSQIDVPNSGARKKHMAIDTIDGSAPHEDEALARQIYERDLVYSEQLKADEKFATHLSTQHYLTSPGPNSKINEWSQPGLAFLSPAPSTADRKLGQTQKPGGSRGRNNSRSRGSGRERTLYENMVAAQHAYMDDSAFLPDISLVANEGFGERSSILPTVQESLIVPRQEQGNSRRRGLFRGSNARGRNTRRHNTLYENMLAVQSVSTEFRGVGGFEQTGVPDHIDESNIGDDYEELWELAETLGDVKDKGMSAEQIAALPCSTLKTASTAEAKETPEQQDKDCKICMSDLKMGEQIKILPCLHKFHSPCIDEWIRRMAVCPICKLDIKEELKGANACSS